MSYTPPDGDNIVFDWSSAPSYTPPAGDAITFSWSSTPTTVEGDGAVLLDFLAEGSGIHGVAVSGDGAVTLDFSGDAAGGHGVAGAGVAGFDFAAAGTGVHGVAGTGSASFDFTGAGAAVHPRYELRGEVKIGDVLVNRRVRAYNRGTGALVSEADTVSGKFNLPVGFVEDEFYVTPIDLDPDAVDWKPPTANRVPSVLADDAA